MDLARKVYSACLVAMYATFCIIAYNSDTFFIILLSTGINIVLLRLHYLTDRKIKEILNTLIFCISTFIAGLGLTFFIFGETNLENRIGLIIIAISMLKIAILKFDLLSLEDWKKKVRRKEWKTDEVW